jgi:uncharacterized protein with von Willebrand factor type A (vWA) domain
VLTDPVEVLFTAQLGGGTDIHRAVAYAQQELIEKPDRTLLLLITDLYEGGDAEAMIARLHELKESQVKVLCILALGDGGRPSYNAQIAEVLEAMGIPTFASTPELLVDAVERLMKNQPIESLVASAKETR